MAFLRARCYIATKTNTANGPTERANRFMVFLRNSSITTRVTLYTLLIFVTSIWAVALYAGTMLRKDMLQHLGDQQFSSVAIIADEINDDFAAQIALLEQVATHLGTQMQLGRRSPQALLEEQFTLNGIFNAGAYIAQPDGTAIASIPLSIPRLGLNYLERDNVAAALKDGKSGVGQPAIGKALNSPVISVAVPIRASQDGRVIAALVGVVDLGQPNFLDKINSHTYGKTGGYLLLAPQQRLVVTATDKGRVMEQLPAAGVNPQIDKFMAGYEGSQILKTPAGMEVLASAKNLSVVPWKVSAMLPTVDVFSPVVAMQRRIFEATLLCTLLAGVAIWWLLRKELTPLFEAAHSLAHWTDLEHADRAITINRNDEVGQLLQSFNQMLGALREREQQLRESETRFRTLMEQIPGVAVQGYTLDGTVTFWNKATERLYGFSRDEALGANMLDLIIPAEMQESVREAMQQMAVTGVPIPTAEISLATKGGSRVSVLSNHGLLTPIGKPPELFCMDIDLSEVRKAQAQMALLTARLQVSEDRLTRILDATQMHIWAFNGTSYTYFNKQWFEFTGMDPNVPWTLDSWSALVHPDDLTQSLEIWQAHWHSKTEHDNQFRLRRRDGVYRDFYCHVVPVHDSHGLFQYFQGFNLDVTERKQMEEQVRQLAFYDTLTHLPNRRLLEDRLAHAMAVNKRNDIFGALMFLDLDNFKPLNDAHGHAVGDMLLIEVASRLNQCLRQMDTVARFGGDEFVVMLSELTRDKEASTEQACLVAEKIRLSLMEPYRLTIKQAGHADLEVEHQCSASVGVVLFRGQESSQSDVIKWADRAMYQAKDGGRNRVHFYPT